jgi:hypothetical protein
MKESWSRKRKRIKFSNFMKEAFQEKKIKQNQRLEIEIWKNYGLLEENRIKKE